MSAIKAILFDCDGVLVDSEAIVIEIEIAVLGEYGLAYERAEFRERFMGTSPADFWIALEADSQARLGRSIVDEVRTKMKARTSEAVESRLTEIEGALEAFRYLALPKAVASSSSFDRLELKLRKVGHWDHFAPHVYSADHVQRAKPAPDLFLHAAQQLGVAPATCLVIEDSVNGVKAGLAAGMRVWGFSGGGHMDEAAGRRLGEVGAERIIPNWKAFTAALKEL